MVPLLFTVVQLSCKVVPVFAFQSSPLSLVPVAAVVVTQPVSGLLPLPPLALRSISVSPASISFILPRKYSVSSLCSASKLQLRKDDTITDDDASYSSSPVDKDYVKPSLLRRLINLPAIKNLRRRGSGSSSSSSSSSLSSSGASVTSPSPSPSSVAKTEVSTLEELELYYTDPQRKFRKSRSRFNFRNSNSKSKSKSPKDNDDEDDIDYDALINNLSVKGDTQLIGSPNHPNLTHPVLQLLHHRRRTKSPLTPTHLQPRAADNSKVALVVEGGGMRGCVTAGSVAALQYLGLEDTIDVIYGSSAGTVIGAYFNTRQLPFFGPEIYYDSLTTAGNTFIDTKRLLRAVGLGMIDPRLAKDVITRRNNGKSVLNLDFLLNETLQHRKPLDWEKFTQMQTVQPLKVVASNLKTNDIIVLEMANGGFNNIQELSKCMHASCLIPGIAGPLININTNTISKKQNKATNDQLTTSQKFTLGNNLSKPSMEPLADALVYQPLPYRAAIAEGATHVLVLRSVPDGVDVSGKAGAFDPPILHRFFMRKNRLPDVYRYLRRRLHKRLYAEQVLELNKAVGEEECKREWGDLDGKPQVMAVALPPGSPGVARLETGRREIFEGVRRGFARTYDALVEDVRERGRGKEVAEQCFPEEILDYDPLEVDAKDEAAFDFVRRGWKERGEGPTFPSSLGKSALDAGLPR